MGWKILFLTLSLILTSPFYLIFTISKLFMLAYTQLFNYIKFHHSVDITVYLETVKNVILFFGLVIPY